MDTVFLTKDSEFKKKGILYTNTVLSFFIGACYGAVAVNAFAVRAAYHWFCAAGNRMDSGSKTQHGP